MIEQILRLFSRYREMGKLSRDAGADRIRLQAEVLALRDENSRLQEERDKAIASERESYRVMLNVEYQVKYRGFAPFPDAAHIPEEIFKIEGKPIPSKFINGRTAADEASQKTKDELRRWLDGEEP